MAINRKNRAPVRKKSVNRGYRGQVQAAPVAAPVQPKRKGLHRGHVARKTPLYRAKIAARARRKSKQAVRAQAQANQAAAVKPAAAATKKRRSRRNNALATSFTLKAVAACGVLLGLVIALVVFKDAVFASLLPVW